VSGNIPAKDSSSGLAIGLHDGELFAQESGMPNRIVLWVIALVLLSVAATAGADPILIRFDDQPPGLTSHVIYRPVGLILLSDEHHALAAIFGIGSSAAATSKPNVAFGADAIPPRAFHRDLFGTFVLPAESPSVTFAGTDFLSLAVVGTRPGQTEPWQIVLFGPGRVSLDSASGISDRVVSFRRGAREIRGFEVITSSAHEAIDDVSFNAPSTPEPSTLAMISIGLALIVRKRRRGW
jgi:hypothetical protein